MGTYKIVLTQVSMGSYYEPCKKVSPFLVLRFHSVSNDISLKLQLFCLYLLDDFHNNILNVFCSLPLIKKVPRKVQILFFIIIKVIFMLVLSKVTFTLGYLFMEDLHHALSQFYNPSSGGMSGGSSTPPGPSGDGSGVALASENHNEPAPSAYEGQEGSFHFRREPLLSDAQRRMELERELQRLIDNQVIASPSPSERSKLLNAQFECELKLEGALRSDGFRDEKIVSCRDDWRRAAFSPASRPAPSSSKAMQQTMAKYSNIRQTPYYKRIHKAIEQNWIHLKD